MSATHPGLSKIVPDDRARVSVYHMRLKECLPCLLSYMTGFEELVTTDQGEPAF